jgi:rhamnose utilization protein RhaD (predicted bifunctional aldolase and dehydrogenase)
MAIDREAILDALMEGSSIAAVADLFDLREAEVRQILKEETDRAYNGEEMRAEWTLTARRLRRMELAFDAKAIADLDCNCAIVAIKASERRASLSGAGSAQPSHLIAVMHAKAIEEAPTSTEQMRRALDSLKHLRDPALWSPEERERAAQTAEKRARFLRGEGPDPDQD